MTSIKKETWHKASQLFDLIVEQDKKIQHKHLEDASYSLEVRALVKKMLIQHGHTGHAFTQDSHDLLKDIYHDAQITSSIEKQDLTGQTLGHWTILSELAEGGMSRVFLANRTDGQFDKQVAIKLMQSKS
ncbi:MAG: hypothetical protein ACWA5R_03720 [bacterium]